MFGKRFFAPVYFARRYFPPRQDDVANYAGTLIITRVMAIEAILTIAKTDEEQITRNIQFEAINV